jgi:hypothetical protein
MVVLVCELRTLSWSCRLAAPGFNTSGGEDGADYSETCFFILCFH